MATKTRTTRLQRHKQVAKLLDKGLTFQQVADKLGLAKSTVTAAYYDPSGDKDRERKRRVHGNCVDCGVEVYNSGSPDTPERCLEHRIEQQRTDPEYLAKASRGSLKRGNTYTRMQILNAMRDAANRYGQPLRGDDYNAYRAAHGGPSEPLIIRRFDTWQKALRAAGLDIGKPMGRYANRTPNEALLDMVWACARDIGRRPSYNEYETWQRERSWAVSGTTIRNRLGTWHKATLKAGVNDMNGNVHA